MPDSDAARAVRRDPGRVTITDLARALGVTKSTVSRALNGYPDISEATRLKVSRMAERMGYRPLSQAQAIRTGRVRALGFVIQMGDHDAHRPFLADFLAGVSRAASAEGWTLTVAASESAADTLAVMRTLVRDCKADGFVLPRTMTEDPRVALLRATATPFVMYGRTGDGTGCAWFDYDGGAAMRDAVLRLARLGHRRIGFVNSGAVYNFARLRLEGYRDGLAAADLPADPDLETGEAYTAAEGAAAAARLLALPCPPTAIVFATDAAALGLYRVVAAHGLTLGQDLSAIGYDGAPEGAMQEPGLCSYVADARRAGTRLAGLLIRRIRGEPPEALREVVPAGYLSRGTVGPPALTSEALAARLAARPAAAAV